MLSLRAKRSNPVIAMCDVSNLNKFFDLVNEKYGLWLECPPIHVTLYTLQQGKEIFLIDLEGIEKMAKSLKNPGIKLERKKF